MLKITQVKENGSLGKDPIIIETLGKLGAFRLCWTMWRVYGFGVRVEDISETSFFLLRNGTRVMRVEYFE